VFLQELKADGPIIPPLFILPGHDSLCLVPAHNLEAFERDLKDDSEREPDWLVTAYERLRLLNVHHYSDLYKAGSVEPTFPSIAESFLAESAKHLRAVSKLSGREFERFAGEVFAAFGFDVVASVRLLGGEIDLLLVEFSKESPPRFTLVECKHLGKSGRPVNLAQVMRLYGFCHALDRLLRRPQALLLSSTSFTHPAKSFAHLQGIELLDFQKLVGWLRERRQKTPLEKHAPILGMAHPRTDGSIKLEKALLSYMFSGTGREATVVGNLAWLELYDFLHFMDVLRSTPISKDDEQVLNELGI